MNSETETCSGGLTIETVLDIDDVLLGVRKIIEHPANDVKEAATMSFVDRHRPKMKIKKTSCAGHTALTDMCCENRHALNLSALPDDVIIEDCILLYRIRNLLNRC